jgi:GT2 family glycosyltransferase
MRQEILASFPQERWFDALVFEQHLHPAIETLRGQCAHFARAKTVLQFGQPVDRPGTSLIVPIYKRLDFVHKQVSLFANDPEMASCELVYVLDSPEHATDLENQAYQLQRLYGLPLRLVIAEHNLGFGGANNLGAAAANASRFLFLNSDVFPCRPGWVSILNQFYATQNMPCIAGARLLFADDSLQHAGMFFIQGPGPSHLWYNAHYYKGMHRCHPPALVRRQVPAVTGALMLMDRRIFEDCGGWDDSYVQGDYEDSHFCLRAHELGYPSWYVPEAELYHLERMSYSVPGPGCWQQNAMLYNRWLQHKRWNTKIENLMKDPVFAPLPAAD